MISALVNKRVFATGGPTVLQTVPDVNRQTDFKTFSVFTDMINIPWEDVLLITRVSAEIAEAILEADCGNPLLLDEAAAEAAQHNVNFEEIMSGFIVIFLHGVFITVVVK